MNVLLLRLLEMDYPDISDAQTILPEFSLAYLPRGTTLILHCQLRLTHRVH